MKYIITIWLIIFLFGCSSTPKKQAIPQTVNEAVNLIISNLKEEDKELIIAKSEKEMNDFSLAWNINIINIFKLHYKNSILLKNCNSNLDAFSCSDIIIKGVRKKLRAIRPREEIEGIDNTLLMLRKIIIPPYSEKDKGFIRFVEYINNEIQKSSYRNKLEIVATCDSTHYRLQDFFNENSQTVKEILKYIDLQELAHIKIRPGIVYLTPKPFLNSKPCDA